MPDGVTVDNPTNGDYDVSTDDAGAAGQVQRVKLAYSADGSATHVQADADGVLVNLGANNDVVVSDGGGSITVDASTLPLPTGAATAAKQPALGSAGTPSADVLTVQGVSGGTALPVSDGGSTLTVDDGGGSITVDGTVAISGTVAVTDNSGSLTVDNATLAVTGGGTESGALRVTLATDSTGVVSVDDGGSSLTVDGTVTADAGTGPWPVTDNGGSLTVDGTVAATQSGTWNVGTVGTVTNVVHVDDNSSTLSVDDGGSSLTVDNAGTFAVQVSSALPAGTNAIGKLAANSGVDIGDVDVTSVPADPFGANADAASASGSISAKLRQIATNGVPVTSSALPTGAATAAKQPALGTAGSSSTDVLSVQGIASGTALPVSAASLPLPSGASTAAKQPALGTAGSPSSDVLTVQGVTSMTALKVDGSGVTQPVSGTVTANAGTNLNTSALALESGGNLATLVAATKLEDAAHADGDRGVAVWARRADTPTVSSGADGDYSTINVGGRGELWTGLVRHNTRLEIAVTSSGLTTASTAYVYGDVLGAEMTFANAARISGGGGTLRKIVLINNDTQLGAVDLFLFDSASTPASDNNANSWSDANMQKNVGVIPLVPYATSALNQVLMWEGDSDYSCAATSLFGVLVTRSGHTFFGAATAILVRMWVERA